MKIIPFAFKNILRNRRRSLLAMSSVFLSILMVVILGAFANGFLDSLVKNYIKNETGHLNISTKAYRDKARFMPVEEYIEDASSLAALLQGELAKVDPKATVAQRIRFGVLLSSEKGTKQALGVAGDPELEKGLLMLHTLVQAGGSYISAPGQAIIGAKLAEDLGLGVGDPLKIVTQKSDGGLGFKRLSIAGIFKTGVNAFDGSLFQMSLADAQDLLGMEDGAQQISIMFSNRKNLGARTEATAGLLKEYGRGDLSLLPWTAIGEYPKMIQLMEVVYLWVYVVVGFLGAFIIANVMTMVVLERKRETGILMAMGMPKRQILAMFLAEGTLLGLAGSLAGTVAGFLFNAAFAEKGFDMTSAMAGFAWPLDNVIYPSVTAGSLVTGILIGTLVSAVVAYFPSRRAAAMAPVEAIRAS
ncbi:MAG: FtsX-like permease family protein [Spirochaetota bacterium]